MDAIVDDYAVYAVLQNQVWCSEHFMDSFKEIRRELKKSEAMLSYPISYDIHFIRGIERPSHDELKQYHSKVINVNFVLMLYPVDQ